MDTNSRSTATPGTKGFGRNREPRTVTLMAEELAGLCEQLDLVMADAPQDGDELIVEGSSVVPLTMRLTPMPAFR